MHNILNTNPSLDVNISLVTHFQSALIGWYFSALTAVGKIGDVTIFVMAALSKRHTHMKFPKIIYERIVMATISSLSYLANILDVPSKV